VPELPDRPPDRELIAPPARHRRAHTTARDLERYAGLFASRTRVMRSWDALGFDGFARVDMIVGEHGPEVLEANAIPGFTDTSLLPMSAEAAGMSFERLCERLIELALERAGAGEPLGN